MNRITTHVELRTILRDAINANGVEIPLSQRTQKGLEHFKATNGLLYTIMTLNSDASGIDTATNIRPKAPLVELQDNHSLALDVELTNTIEPTKEAVLAFFSTTLLAFRTTTH
ncbi:hypothetical protein OH460_07545 [Vibrio sp. Makdt]|uniref:hypothetical protein n=1 Tax=Vibrio sp. Makdt TaxID=2998828 RepID=UPI0022CD4D14|nr:hypothetical protein [Vibrio sp. Makdt]MDA0152151.1 hypothetical protein [Vibrio sp. Makdt]